MTQVVRGVVADAGYSVTWRELYDAYQWKYAAVRFRKRTLERNYSASLHLIPFFGEVKIEEIDGYVVDDYRALRKRQGASNTTINVEVRTLHKPFMVAWKRGKIDRIPFQIDPLEEGPPRTKYITPEELPRLLEAAGPYWSRIWRWAILTGMRRNEMRFLKHEQVNCAAKSVFMTDTKTGKGQIQWIPLPPAAIGIYRSFPLRLRCPFVFHNPETGKPWDCWTHVFKRHAIAAGIQGVSLHSLRHTFASYHAMRGTPVLKLKRLGRWKDSRMVDRYAHLAPEDLLEAAGNIGVLVLGPENEAQKIV